MNEMDQAWRRLAVAARRAPPAEIPAVPFGLATRIAARWGRTDATGADEPWNWLARPALMGAAALAAGAVALSYEPMVNAWTALSGSAAVLEVLLPL